MAIPVSRKWLLAIGSLILIGTFIAYSVMNRDDHFILEGMGEIRGTLLSADGSPLHSFAVRLDDLQGRDARPKEFGASGFRGVTAESGQFAFWARPGTYWVYARVLSDIETNRVRVTVREGKIVDGIVLRFPVALPSPSPG